MGFGAGFSGELNISVRKSVWGKLERVCTWLRNRRMLSKPEILVLAFDWGVWGSCLPGTCWGLELLGTSLTLALALKAAARRPGACVSPDSKHLCREDLQRTKETLRTSFRDKNYRISARTLSLSLY